MSRPRKSDESVSGRERIQQAFWSLYLDRPFEKVTVKDVCALAGCNKTTFYYYYANIDEVLLEIEDACMPTDVPTQVAGLLHDGSLEFVPGLYLAEYGPRFEMMCHLLGPKGDPAFARRLKDTMAQRWCQAFGVAFDQLCERDRLLIEFVMGGTTSLFASHAEGRDVNVDLVFELVREVVEPHLKALAGTDVSAGEVPEELSAAAFQQPAV